MSKKWLINSSEELDIIKAKLDDGKSLLIRPHSFWDFSGRGLAGISIPNSTFSSSNGTEIILFRNKSPKFNQIYHHYSSYSCSSSYSTLWGGIDGTDGILFQFYLFPKNVAFHLLFVFLYSTSSYFQKLSKGIQSKTNFYLMLICSLCFKLLEKVMHLSLLWRLGGGGGTRGNLPFWKTEWQISRPGSGVIWQMSKGERWSADKCPGSSGL